MSDIQIVRVQKIGLGAHGQDVQSDEVYIKVLASFQDRLKDLKGARLHAFMCVACHEAKIMLGLASPLSLSSIQKIIGYSRHTVIDALDFLVAERFLEELSERGKAGEKLYRVCAFAWYGRERHSVCRAGSQSQAAAGAKTAPVQKKLPIVVDKDSSSSEDSEKQQQQQMRENFARAPENRFDPDELERIKKAFWALGIWENAWSEQLALPYMSVEYAEDWVEHKHREGKRLTGAFYRGEMRAGRESPYGAPPPEEKPFPLTREDFTDALWERMNPINRQAIAEGRYYSDGRIR